MTRDSATALRIVRRSLTDREKIVDSNERELLAVLHLILIQSLIVFLKGKRIKIHVDNPNAADIIMTGSNKPRLHYYSRLLYICILHDIHIHVSWIPRSLNNLADIFSKTYDGDSYSVCNSFYNIVIADFVITPNLDVFADQSNCTMPRFYSKFLCPHTLGVDAFPRYTVKSPNAPSPNTLSQNGLSPNETRPFCPNAPSSECEKSPNTNYVRTKLIRKGGI
jgi:hypothetical protein